jgi:hypothetical protein
VAILLGGSINGRSIDGAPSLGGERIAPSMRRAFDRAGRVRYILISAGNLPSRQDRVPEALFV